ncbi:MAG: tetratricopeptide repeat protein [Anaerolineae bacterium]|nr:tetratricopeptide repeat protein [Phycisphaerae bacterium]
MVAATAADYLRKANAALQANRLEEAATAFRRVIMRQRDHPDALFGLSFVLLQLRRPAEALATLKELTTLYPRAGAGWRLLAVALASSGERGAAVDHAHERAIACSAPNDPSPHTNYGTSLLLRGDTDRAAESFRRALAIDPNDSVAAQNLANALSEEGKVAEAIELRRRAGALVPDDPKIGSKLLLDLHYLPDLPAEQIFDEHVRWVSRHADPGRWPPPAYRNARDPARRLRVGYVSPDFRRHPVLSFIQNVLTGHDRAQFEVFAYSNTAAPDQITAKLRDGGVVDVWRDIAFLSDDAASKLIQDDQIDVLVDLAGHTGENRATLFARAPAPAQFTYLGYPDTTGVRAIQFRLTDQIADPPGTSEPLATEMLIRLPDCFLCYRPDDDAPAPLPETPAVANGFITFGSFNNFAKVTDSMLALWGSILRDTPGSRIVFKAKSFASEVARQRVLSAFAKFDVAEDRVSMHSWVTYDQRHAIVAGVDIALDTFPYNGTTTTCEILWLGVPCITLAGQTHVTRVSASILRAIGHPELITSTPDQYRLLAIDLARDIDRLNAYRSQINQHMADSPLVDAPRFVRNLENVYRVAWETWCKSSA